MSKPIVFNYSDYEKVVEENKKLKAEVANLLIRCRIAEADRPKWIPTGEMWPENKTYVLTTIYIPGRQPHARSGWYKDGLFFNDNGDVWNATDMEVTAWMPLPDPYKEDEHE